MQPGQIPTGTSQNDSAIALQMLQEGKPRQDILAFLINKAEETAGEGCVSSILVLDNEGLLRNGSSPHLPFDYLAAIDGLKPNPFLGTCASAAATGNMVVTLDFKTDNKWAELRHLPLSLGFVGAWSMPIKSTDGKVLGTFGTYYRVAREPSEKEVAVISELASVAAQVLERPMAASH